MLGEPSAPSRGSSLHCIVRSTSVHSLNSSPDIHYQSSMTLLVAREGGFVHINIMWDPYH